MAITKEKLSHECFPQPVDTNILVWRYLDLSKFIWLLNKKKLYLSRLDSLGDLHEGSLTKKSSEAIAKHISDNANLSKIPKDLINKISEVRRKIRKIAFVNCWCLINFESDAMWRLYCGSKQGIAIQTTYHKLRDSIIDPDVYIGCIIYKDYKKEIIQISNLFYPLMHKRIAFKHENEVRLVKILGLDRLLEKEKGVNENPTGIELAWDLKSAVEKIYIHPNADQYYKDVVELTVKKFAPDLVDKIEWSEMKSIPFY